MVGVIKGAGAADTVVAVAPGRETGGEVGYDRAAYVEAIILCGGEGGIGVVRPGRCNRQDISQTGVVINTVERIVHVAQIGVGVGIRHRVRTQPIPCHAAGIIQQEQQVRFDRCAAGYGHRFCSQICCRRIDGRGESEYSGKQRDG